MIKGADRQVVGQLAEIRCRSSSRALQGKGIRYANEKVVIKETKKEVRSCMMLNKKEQRHAVPVRLASALPSKALRLSVNRTNLHIYASVVLETGTTVLASASTAEVEVRSQLGARWQNWQRNGRRHADRQAHC